MERHPEPRIHRRAWLIGSALGVAACTPNRAPQPPHPVQQPLPPQIGGHEDGRIIFVSSSGSDSNDGHSWASAVATIQTALERADGGPSMILLSVGTFDVQGTCRWPRAKVSLRGQGPGLTKIKCTNQSGPILDFSDVAYEMNGCVLSGFSVEGDRRPGSEKVGIKFATSPMPTFLEISDISISGTGGAGFDAGALEISSLRGLVIYEPVDCAARDVPYFIGRGAFNGNTLESIVLVGESPPGRASVGKSGALRILPDDEWAPHGNVLRSVVTENLRMQSDSTVIHVTGGDNLIDAYLPFDCSALPGATGSSHIRFTAAESRGSHDASAAAASTGGNRVTGVIPGGGSGATMGIDMRQSYNSVDGVKGYKGRNVVISPGVGHCSVKLAGSIGQATDMGVEDHSGEWTNRVADGLSGSALAGQGVIPVSGAFYGPPFHGESVAEIPSGRVFFVPLTLGSGGHFVEAAMEIVEPSLGSQSHLGVYSSNPLDRGRPSVLTHRIGAVDLGEPGVKSLECDIKLSAGCWWLAIMVSGATAKVRSLGDLALPEVNQLQFSQAANGYQGTVSGNSLPARAGSCVPSENSPKLMLKAG